MYICVAGHKQTQTTCFLCQAPQDPCALLCIPHSWPHALNLVQALSWAQRRAAANQPDQLWHTLDVGDLRGERRSHRCLLLRQRYPSVGHLQSLKPTGAGSWRGTHPPFPLHLVVLYMFSSVLCHWCSIILWPSWSHFSDIFPPLELKYFFCSFNPTVPIYSSLNYPSLSPTKPVGVCAYLSCWTTAKLLQSACSPCSAPFHLLIIFLLFLMRSMWASPFPSGLALRNRLWIAYTKPANAVTKWYYGNTFIVAM